VALRLRQCWRLGSVTFKERTSPSNFSAVISFLAKSMDPPQTSHVIEEEDGETTGIRQHDYLTEGSQGNIQIRGSRAQVHLPNEPLPNQPLPNQFQNVSIDGSRAQVHIGNVYNTIGTQNVSLFSSLVMVPSEPNLNETAITTLANRARYQAGRQVRKTGCVLTTVVRIYHLT